MTKPNNHLLSPEQREQASTDLSQWSVGHQRLHRRFEFGDFPAAIAFMVRASYAAERLDHHPNWSNVYNTVEVEISSHDLGGVSALCIELAKALDLAFE
jgi:4a-hydroxytetrahydrobiopterin dehydratase